MTKTPSKKKAAAKKVPDNLPEDFYEVEAVIGRRRYRGRVEYKIRWKGCSDKDDTWEPHENLSDSAMELAIQFTKRQKLKQQREEDAKEVAGSPLTKQSLSASKSEQSPLIKRGGRTVFGSIRHRNRQVRFQLSQTKSFVSNAPNELHIEGKPDESPVSAHFFGTPTIVALPAEEVNDIMVMPSASSGLPSTAILGPNTMLRELTANFEDEEEDFEDWACSKCKFSCVCSAGRPCEMKTPTLFAMVSHMVFSLHLFITLQPDFLSFFTTHMVEPIVFYCNFNPQS